MSADKPIGSGLGTVSTCISSNGFDTMDVRGFPLECAGIVIILHDVHMLSIPGVRSTSRQRLCACIVAKTPSGLCSRSWRMFVFILILLSRGETFDGVLESLLA